MPGTSTEQVVDKGIRQKSTKEWTHSLTAVPFVRGHRSVFPQTPRNTGVYTRHPTFVTATSGVWTRLPAKLNACLHAVRQAVEKKLRVHVYTASEAKGLQGDLFISMYLLFSLCWGSDRSFFHQIQRLFKNNNSGCYLARYSHDSFFAKSMHSSGWGRGTFNVLHCHCMVFVPLKRQCHAFITHTCRKCISNFHWEFNSL